MLLTPMLKHIITSQISDYPYEQDISRKKNYKNRPTDNNKIEEEIINAFSDAVSFLPYSLQAHLFDDKDRAIWCTLNKDYLVCQTSDIIIKYGVSLGNNWYILGMLDVLPKNEAETSETGVSFESCVKKINQGKNVLWSALETFIPECQKVVGKSDSAYGITPLLIFREIN